MDPSRFGLCVTEQTLKTFVATLARLLVAEEGRCGIAVIEAVNSDGARFQIAYSGVSRS